MIRLKIIKPHTKYNVGDTIYVSPNEAHGLIDQGFATKSKDMTATDYRTANGRPTKLRTNRRSKR